MMVGHPDGTDTMSSGTNKLITIWNSQQANRKRLSHIYARNMPKIAYLPFKLSKEDQGFATTTPPRGPAFSGTCRCGRGGKARIYDTGNDRWICGECSDDRITGRDAGASTPPPPPDGAPCDLEEEGSLCSCDRGKPASTERNRITICELCAEDADFIAEYRCKCNSGKAATLYHAGRDEFRCRKCLEGGVEEKAKKDPDAQGKQCGNEKENMLYVRSDR